MPLFRNSKTGEIVERSERYVLAHPKGKFTSVNKPVSVTQPRPVIPPLSDNKPVEEGKE